jgi:hypothetical protein
MRSKIIKLLVIINILFIGTQVPLTFFTQKTEPLPEVTFEKFRNGDYGRELEQYFKNNSYLSEVSSKTYKAFLDLFFKRSNKHVLIGKKNFLFLRERTEEYDVENLNERIDEIVDYIKDVNNMLVEKGISLRIIPIPNRSRVYPEYAYRTGEIPKNRSLFYPKLIDALNFSSIKVIDPLERMLKEKRKNSIPVFFRVDHHWTWLFNYKFVDDLFEILSYDLNLGNNTRGKLYEFEWEKKVNAHDKIARKLGYSRNFIPNIFKETQLVPKFDKDRKDYNADLHDNIIILSSSYGGYGIVEFLSNLIERYIPSYVSPGNGPTYAMTQFLSNHLNVPNSKKPNIAIWLLSEVELFNLHKDSIIPPIINTSSLKKLEYMIKSVRGAKLDRNVFWHRAGKIKINLEIKKKTKDIVIKLKSRSKKRKSVITLDGKTYDIVHDGSDLYYPIEFNERKKQISIEIDTYGTKNPTEGRSYELMGVFSRI